MKTLVRLVTKAAVIASTIGLLASGIGLFVTGVAVLIGLMELFAGLTILCVIIDIGTGRYLSKKEDMVEEHARS